MDLLELPEVKTRYEKCKYVVKLWEHNFKKEKNRLPSKLDIREADKKVRDAYRQYYQLKTAALEQSFKDVDGFNSDEENAESEKKTSTQPLTETASNIPENAANTEPGPVWGPHLDKKPPDEPKKRQTTSSKLTQNLSHKLFCGSKMSRRNPRKSQSFAQRNKTASFEIGFLSQPTASSSAQLEDAQTNNLSFEGIFSKNVKVASVQNTAQSQSTSLMESALFNRENKALRTVDTGWLERVGKSSGVEMPKPLDLKQDQSNMSLEYDSDIIDNSDEDSSFSLDRLAKKPKLSLPSEKKPEMSVNVAQKDENKLSETDVLLKEPEKVQPIYKTSSEIKPEENVDVFEFINDSPVLKTSKNGPKKAVKDTEKPLKRTLPRRATKTNVSMAEFISDDEDPYQDYSDDSEFTLEKEKNRGKSALEEIIAEMDDDDGATAEAAPQKGKKMSKKGKTTKKTEKVEEEEENDTYELEYSVKPRVAAPRFKNIKKLITIETKAAKSALKQSAEPKTKSKREQDRDKLEKKAQSGSLNENFVQINLRKKIYVRGKKTMNFGKYKKQQWRGLQKAKALAGPEMDMGGCDGGMLTCFKCGQTGHFARNCRSGHGDGLLPLLAEEVSAFPTLEEAAQMAKEEEALVVRKPRKAMVESTTNVEHDEDETVDESDEERDGDKVDDLEDNDDLFDDAETEAMLAEALRIEEHYAKLDLQGYVDPVRAVQPYYSPREDGGLIDTPAEVFDALKKFGHSSFRAGQERAVMRILSGKSTLVTLSTGSGKSLCYQIPAYIYSRREPCISLIISPLVSLMEDQVTGIPNFLKAACLHTNKTKIQREKIMEAMRSGELDILLVSPEAIVAGEKSSGFGSLLRKLPPIAFACIDEAHCVSQWSHNFRPSYLMICRVLREKMGVKTILGLTATATRSTSDNIIDHLSIPDGRAGIISDTPLPNNLSLTVSKDYNRDNALVSLLTSDRFQNYRSIIIYCTRREECNRIASLLRTSLRDNAPNSAATVGGKKRKRTNAQVEPYHAGLPASRRRTIQNAFMTGELRIVVATVAFGMGINKANIRAVIHYNMPKSFESYVQEIGRAGRDGLPAHCHAFLDAKGNDENELRRHIYADSVDRRSIRKLLHMIFLPCACANKAKDVGPEAARSACPKHEVAFSIEKTVRILDIPEENISTLLCYLELHEKKYIELLSPAYTACKVISYGGPLQIRKAAKECPPLAMALALQKNDGGNDQNVIEFAVVDIAAAIGWDSGICKHKLKNLEWFNHNGVPKRSNLSVSFSDLGFRLLAPGNLTDEMLDEALDSLYEHTCKQEETALLQLRALHEALVEVAVPSFRACVAEDAEEVNERLKARVREYFESKNPIGDVVLKDDERIVDVDMVKANVRQLISMYRDNNFTGRAVGRIFHGIQSPNYPAVVWGRCKFWRAHINVNFHTICKIATKEILSFR